MPPAGKKRKRTARGGGEAAFRNKLDRVIAAFSERAQVSARSARPRAARPPRSSPAGGLPEGLTLAEATRQFQFEIVRDALENNKRGGRWNIAATAKVLGVARSFLYRLMEEMEKSAKDPRAKGR